MTPLANTLLQQQLQYFGNVARDFNHPGRYLVFKQNGWEMVDQGLRRQGRPRADWGQEIMKHVMTINNDFVPAIVDRNNWRKIVNDYCRNLK